MSRARAVQARNIKSVMGNESMNIIEEFKKVRDIPYRIPLSLEEPDDCCSGKSDRLFKIFKSAGYDVRYRVCTFRWSDMTLPAGVQEIPHEDECTHSYLEIKIGDAWIIVDATWDKGLESAFDISGWDGRSSTKVAVPVREYFTPEKSAEYMEESLSPEAIAEDIKKNGQFYKVFNEWLEEVRRKSAWVSE